MAKHFEGQRDQFVYVSLYGLSSLEEIDDALFQAIFPRLTGTAAKVIGRVAKSALKIVKVDTSEFDVRDFLNKFDAKVYVFDDLERFEGSINKALGYINQFVEHGGAKVILIANEQEIPADKDYSRRREKLIGKTLHAHSSFDEAFAFFVSKIEDADAKKLAQNCAAEIVSIYDQSKLKNLRILQQTIWDFERFFKAISTDHRHNNDALATVMRLLFALSFDLKSGRIGEPDLLEDRGIGAAVAARMRDKKSEEPVPPMRMTATRYPAIDIDDAIFTNELLVDFLVRGIVDADVINAQLRASRFFVRVSDEPAWRTVWHYFERTETEFENALAKMESQYAAREFTNSGEILHVMGLRLLLAEHHAITISRLEVLEEGKKYIDDIYKSKKLNIDSRDTSPEARFDSYGGLGIHENKKTEYKELSEYLRSATQRAFEDTFGSKAVEVLSEMKSDIQELYRRLCYSTQGTGEYAGIPVLAKLSANDFLDAFLSLHPSSQHVVMMALKARYEHGRLRRELSDEKLWLEQIRDNLLTRAKTMKPMSRLRIANQVAWYIDPAL